MKIKLHWGHGIIIFFIIFLASVAIRVYISSNQNFDLVSSDYYPKEIEYQKQINKINNTTAFKDQIKVIQRTDSFIIDLPKAISVSIKTGSITFYRPSNKTLDKKFVLKADTMTTRSFSKDNFVKGKYLVQLEWCDIT